MPQNIASTTFCGWTQDGKMFNAASLGRCETKLARDCQIIAFDLIWVIFRALLRRLPLVGFFLYVSIRTLIVVHVQLILSYQQQQPQHRQGYALRLNINFTRFKATKLPRVRLG